MRVLVAIDKFKESLTSFEAASIIERGIKVSKIGFETTILPMADGGDGFAQVLKYYLKTKTIKVKSFDPLFNSINAYYEWNNLSKVAVIELAICSGISLLKEKNRNPLYTSTYGTGVLIKHAIEKGAKKIILGLGGSATNDAGIGIASALGFVFLDKNGNELMPIGASLSNIFSIIPPKNKFKVSFEIATDVNNSLYGFKGASYVYAPQKGANIEQVELLDNGLRNFSKVLKKQTGYNVSSVKGVGAAGGVSAFLLPYFDTKILSGIELIKEISNFNNYLKNCDILITGEGKLDDQSFQGKVVGNLVNKAMQFNKKVLLITGKLDVVKKYKYNQIEIIELAKDNISISYSIKHAKKLLHKNVINYFI